jgi:hypothetical protein
MIAMASHPALGPPQLQYIINISAAISQPRRLLLDSSNPLLAGAATNCRIIQGEISDSATADPLIHLRPFLTWMIVISAPDCNLCAATRPARGRLKRLYCIFYRYLASSVS